MESVVFLSVFAWFLLMSPPKQLPTQPYQPPPDIVEQRQANVSQRVTASRYSSKRTKSKIKAYIKESNPKINGREADEIAHWIEVYSKKENVDPYLVAALIERESSFKKRAVSRTGAKGLGQIKDFNHKSLKIKDPFSVKQNVRGTVSYLKKMHKVWGHSKQKTELALASYYQGPNATKKKKKMPKKVKGYVDDILARYKKLSAK